MLKLTADKLAALGAPNKGGAAQIEEWLRRLLQPGTLATSGGLFELRGPEPVVTTLGDLRKACGVAIETVKQGLRPLEMDHWILLVDGAHTRLLGPPRFRVGVTKENFWGSVGQAIEVTVNHGLSPLESMDFDRLRQQGAVTDLKKTLAVGTVSLSWSTHLKLASGESSSPKEGERFTLAAGSQLRESGESAILQSDAGVIFDGGRQVRLDADGELMRERGRRFALPPNSVLHLERANLVRIADGRTGLLEAEPEAVLSGKQAVDWAGDRHWLGRFRTGLPLVLLRRAIFAELDQVVNESCAGVASGPSPLWRITLGFHDCVLDATIPYRAGQSSLAKSPAALVGFLKRLRPGDSFRQRILEEYGFTVDRADVRTAPAAFAPAYDRDLLRSIAADPETNSELLSLSQKLLCWTQVGAYHARGDVWPWEITREIYFTHVDLHFRQQASPSSSE